VFDGYFSSAAEIAALDAAAQAKTGNPTAKYQDGEAPVASSSAM